MFLKLVKVKMFLLQNFKKIGILIMNFVHVKSEFFGSKIFSGV